MNPTTSSTLISTPPPSKRGKSLVEQVFTKLATKYGNKLGDAYKGQDLRLVKAEWAEQLDAFSVEQIGGALGLATTLHPHWPPTVGEFVLLCRAVRPPEHLKLPAPRAVPPDGIFDRLRAMLKPSSHRTE